jgi:cell division protein ZapA
MAKADITIRGRAYSVACAAGQEDRLISLARQLDGRVSQIADAVGDIGDDRLLLIAALALLDELAASHRGQGAATLPFEIDRAARALDDAASRIEAIAVRIETDT